MKFSLTIRPIDLTGKTVPADLANDPTNTDRFNSANMINRFNALVDYVFTIIDENNLTSLQVGNEIDHYNTSGEHANFWSDYGSFLGGIKSHLAANHPGVKLGTTITLKGALSGTLHGLGVWSAYANLLDVLGITYYPLDDSFNVNSPTAPLVDLQQLNDEYAGNSALLYLQEIGYQTSATNASSASKQAEFFCNFFQAWDSYRAKMPFANIVRLIDISAADSVAMAGPYGGAGNFPFTEYLRTLGLRHYESTGTDKEAFGIIKSEMVKRGF